MRISDWSSDVCSSDLLTVVVAHHADIVAGAHPRRPRALGIQAQRGITGIVPGHRAADAVGGPAAVAGIERAVETDDGGDVVAAAPTAMLQDEPELAAPANANGLVCGLRVESRSGRDRGGR